MGGKDPLLWSNQSTHRVDKGWGPAGILKVARSKSMFNEEFGKG